MKRQGAISDFSAQRRADVIRAYRLAMAQAEKIRVADVMKEAVAMPASRFWVSEERAVNVVSALMRGMHALKGMRPTKARMYAEIMRRVAAVLTECPDMRLIDAVSEVICGEAPEFYMSANTARAILYSHNRA